MSTKITVPELGESVLEATVLHWHKEAGDRVAAGEVVVELETDKVNLDVVAPHDGVLDSIERQAGEDVQVGDVLAVVEEGKEPPEPKAEAEAAPEPEAQAEPEPEPEPDEEAEKVTPVARRLAQERGVDLAQVSGSGPAGRVTKEDVERHLAQEAEKAPTPAPEEPEEEPRPDDSTSSPRRPVEGARPDDSTSSPRRPVEGARPEPVEGEPPRREERVRMSRRRRTIARRLVEAQQTAAMLTTFNDVDMSGVMDLRARRKAEFKERFDVSLGIVSFFVKAAVGALKAFPRLNAEIEENEMILKHYYDIGVAIGASEGLVVPVLRDADRMSFAEIEGAIKSYAQKAEEGSLSLEDLRGGTFTITNGGIFGSLLSTPILNPPQVGILGLHRIEDRPVAVEGKAVVRPMMYLALSYDHRIVDGREAVQFLVRIKELIEDPEVLLLEG